MTETRCEPPPELRERDGWHWLDAPMADDTGKPWPVRWVARCHGWWGPGLGGHDPVEAFAKGYRYLSPVLAPAEADALRQERDAAVAQWAVDQACLANVNHRQKETTQHIATLRAEVGRLRDALDFTATALVAQREKIPQNLQLVAITHRTERRTIGQILDAARAALTPEAASAVEVGE